MSSFRASSASATVWILATASASAAPLGESGASPRTPTCGRQSSVEAIESTAKGLATASAKAFQCSKTLCSLSVYEGKSKGEDIGNVTFVWARLPPAAARMHVQLIERRSTIPTLFESYASTQPALVVTGAFFTSAGNRDGETKSVAEGLHIAKSRKLVDMSRKGMGGVLGMTNQGLSIDSVSLARTKVRDYAEAIQSVPILVDHGKVSASFDPRDCPSNRVAVGVDAAGNVHAFGAFARRNKALTLFEFAQVIASAAKAKGATDISVLNFEGAAAAQIYVPALKKHFGQNDSTLEYFIASVLLLGAQQK